MGGLAIVPTLGVEASERPRFPQRALCHQGRENGPVAVLLAASAAVDNSDGLPELAELAKGLTMNHRLKKIGFVVALLGLTVGQLWAAEETAPRPRKASPKPTVRVLIAYDSLTGNTEKMALGVADGVRQVPGAVAQVKKVADVTQQDLQAADGIILGCPTYYANIPGSMKVVIDDWSWKMKVDFTDKVGGAFATGGGHTGGKEHVVVSLLLFMINNRMIVAGPLYQDEEGEDIWAELGASAATGPLDPKISSQELDAGRRLGLRVASLAKKLRRPGR